MHVLLCRRLECIESNSYLHIASLELPTTASMPSLQYTRSIRNVYRGEEGELIPHEATHDKVTVLFNMPDSDDHCDMVYETNWWDTPLVEFIQTYFDRFELDSNDYWLSYNNAIINKPGTDGPWDNIKDASLEALGITSGDVIRVYKKVCADV